MEHATLETAAFPQIARELQRIVRPCQIVPFRMANTHWHRKIVPRLDELCPLHTPHLARKLAHTNKR
jgi:hypothetical protein